MTGPRMKHITYSHLTLKASGAFITNKNHDKFIKVARNIAAKPPHRNGCLDISNQVCGHRFYLLLLSKCDPSSFVS